MHRFFISSKAIHGQRATITGPEWDHMAKVVRLRPGDALVLFDEAGWEHEAVVESLGSRTAEASISRSHRPERESPLRITLASGLSKGEKMDWVIEKAVELGVSTIIPLVSTYTIPKLDIDKATRRRKRWETIALSAAKQSGRTQVPRILDVTRFEALVCAPGNYDLKLLFWEREPSLGIRNVKEEVNRVSELLLIVGAEGGFTVEEAERATGQGFRSVHLGKRILRTETAAIAAVAVAQFLWGDLGEA